MYCDSCEVRTEFIYVMKKKVDRLCGLVVRVPGYISKCPGSSPGATRFSHRSSRSGTDPLSLVSTTEELLGRKSSSFGLENREYGHRDPSRRLRDTVYPQKLVLTSPASGCRSVGIGRSRTQAMGFVRSWVKTVASRNWRRFCQSEVPNFPVIINT
jgi:hypothetical protein